MLRNGGGDRENAGNIFCRKLAADAVSLSCRLAVLLFASSQRQKNDVPKLASLPASQSGRDEKPGIVAVYVVAIASPYKHFGYCYNYLLL